MSWAESVEALRCLLQGLVFTGRDGRQVAEEAGFAEWARAALDLRRRRGTIFLIGNGASASMASHFAADLAKNAHIRTEVFTDLALITAISNDIGYREVYSEPLRRRALPDDMLVAISSSGRSPNILDAVAVARSSDMRVVTLSAMSPENPLRRAGDLNLFIPGCTYGQAETGHAAILHHWMDMVAAAVATS
jgi:D-sedoheptulose 7-phosphate isomerase